MHDLAPAPTLLTASTEPQVRWSFRVIDEMPMSRYLTEVARLGATHIKQDSFPTDVEQPDPASLYALGEVLMLQHQPHEIHAAIKLKDTVALIQARQGSASLQVSGATREQVEATVAVVSEALGAKDEDPTRLHMAFWVTSSHGTSCTPRQIAAPDWTDIERNYSSDVATAVVKLISVVEEPKAGRLVLWHGAAGTGKTHVVRALARAWSAWCSTHVITDPELLLRDRPSYLVDVLMHSDGYRVNRGRRWKLIVLEDAGELLSTDARRESGQALSRLLNVTDGILGQGMKAIILVTTNEPLGKLHPAVSRPGRCLSQIEFEPLDTVTANRWLAQHQAAARVNHPTALADLYALTRGEVPEVRPAFGFASGR